MEMTGEYRIPASRAQVWAALNDPEILKASIPGCESLERTGENGFAATVIAKVGPVRAKFTGAVTLRDLDPPNGYTISGEGKGGPAGFAKGDARVSLLEDSDATLLRYEVKANVGGKLAQLGSRLIDATAKKLADDFFSTFSEKAAQASAAPLAERPMPDTAFGAPRVEPPSPPPAQEAPMQAAEPAPPPEPTTAEAAPKPSAAVAPTGTPATKGLPTWLWVGGVIVIVAVVLAIFGRG